MRVRVTGGDAVREVAVVAGGRGRRTGPHRQDTGAGGTGRRAGHEEGTSVQGELVLGHRGHNDRGPLG